MLREHIYQVAEGWPVLGTVRPTVQHHLIYLVRTVLGAFKTLTAFHKLYCINSSHIPVGLLSEREHFPERDPVAPHVAGVAERAVVVGLGRVPLDGPFPAAARSVVRAVGGQGAGETEVTDFGLMSVSQQDVPSC